MIFAVVFFLDVSAKEVYPLTEKEIDIILQSPTRYEDDKSKDPNRKPKDILSFSRVAKGHQVLDIYAGGGWYSELFSSAVGGNGKVYSHNDELTWRFGGKELIKRTTNNRLSNVIRVDKVAIEDIDIASKSIDIVFMAINYHDLYFTHRFKNGKRQVMRSENVNYQHAFANVKRILKDNGVLIITDHIAKPGSGYAAANDLHRIDPDIVQFELGEVGFQLLEEAFYLRNPNDNLDVSVFKPEIRGKTSRFVYKFAKKGS